MRKTSVFLSLFILLFIKQLSANNFEIVDRGFIHEAFMPKENGTLILKGVQQPPPEAVREKAPSQNNPNLQWIPGYWHWSDEHQDFYWITGVWRRPPPGLLWTTGKWIKKDNEWVWLKGFWSTKEESGLQTVPAFPPNPIDERVPAPPNAEFFWIPGFWTWNKETGKYHWLSGRWDLFDPKWIYIPAHYESREKGVVFIPGYWDWTLNQRGIAYAPVFINSSQKDSQNAFLPSAIVPESLIMEIYYPWWPSYLSHYQYHFNYHPDLWEQWNVVPPWWKWKQWWGLSYSEQWALWWWWTHPGFPAPSWISSEIAKQLPPPSDFILKLMEHITTPAPLSFEGSMNEESLLKELSLQFEAPILPSDVKQRQEIYDSIVNGQQRSDLRPQGKDDKEQILNKPFFGPSLESLKAIPGRIKLATKPLIVEEKVAEEAAQKPETKQPLHRRTPCRASFPQSKTPSVRSPMSGRPPGTPPTYKPSPFSEYKSYPSFQESQAATPKMFPQPMMSPPSTMPSMAPPSSCGRGCSPYPGKNKSPKRIPSYTPPTPYAPQTGPGYLPGVAPHGGAYPPATPYGPGPYAPYSMPPPSYHHRFPYQPPSSQLHDLRAERYQGPQIRAPAMAPTEPYFNHTYQGGEHMMPWPELPLHLQNRGDFMNHPMPQRNRILPPANDPTGLWN